MNLLSSHLGIKLVSVDPLYKVLSTARSLFTAHGLNLPVQIKCGVAFYRYFYTKFF